MGRKVKGKLKVTPFSQLEVDKTKNTEITTLGNVDDVRVLHFKNKKGNPSASVIAISDKIDNKQILIADRNTAGIKEINVKEDFNKKTGEKTYNLVAKTGSNKIISTVVSIKPIKPKKTIKGKRKKRKK